MSIPEVYRGLEPALVWGHFATFNAFPRPSGQEAALRAAIRAWASERGFSIDQDQVGNLVVRVPGRGKGIDAPPVIVQGHLDMVCEKNSDTAHDFDNDPITPVRNGDRIFASRTTLGADNGIGCALGMAAADGEYADHPPLELLFTVDEETGMSGARELDASMLSAARMINLDAEEEGVLFVGCAGGQDTILTRSMRTVPATGPAWNVSVTGLKGGHSGLDIIKNRANAIRLLAWAIHKAGETSPLALASLSGGSKRNAIPREAHAIVVGDNPTAILRELEPALRTLHQDADPGWTLHVEPASTNTMWADGQALLQFILSVPNGVLSMSQAIDGLVETSSNLGVVTTEGQNVHVVVCTRSSNMPALDEAATAVAFAGQANGFDWKRVGGYPGWQPDMSSGMLAITRKVFADLAGSDPEVTAIHAGLECGLLSAKLPHLDMISFGPDIQDAHSPDESVSIPSVAAVSRQFGELLRALC